MSSTPPDTPSPEASPDVDGFINLNTGTSATDFASPEAPRVPSTTVRSAVENPLSANMTASSTPLGSLNAARRPAANAPFASARSGGLSEDMAAKMKAFHLSRRGTPPIRPVGGMAGSSNQIPTAIGGSIGEKGSGSPIMLGSGGGMPGQLPGGLNTLRLPPGARPPTIPHNSAPAVPNARLNPNMGLAAKRGLKLNRPMKLSDASGPQAGVPGGGVSGTASLTGAMPQQSDSQPESLFNKYAEFVDTATGTLKFKGKATIHGGGIDFSSGSSFSISLDEVDTIDELGKGNYGTVYQVRHARPKFRRSGLGLAGNKAPPSLSTQSSSSSLITSPHSDSDSPRRNSNSLSPISSNSSANSQAQQSSNGTSGLVMAMKEIRLELDDAKFAAIIMELDILHRCVSPFIVDFYGAFFQEGAVYICMEFMDGGSIDKLYGDGVPENVLRKIALSTVMGLKSLKDDHNIIHRDVKPTNILVNTRGQIKICDFGVSGNLVASIAKTNIGCQSYMAPERIKSGGVAQAGANAGGTYSVASDVWSLGLSIIECALGSYPYPPETYNNIFSQLSAIVEGDPPELPKEGYSDAARSFVNSCLIKEAKDRPSYAMLAKHPWLAPLLLPPTITEEDETAFEASENITPPNTADEMKAEMAAEAESLAETVAAVEQGIRSPSVATTEDKEVAEWAKGAIERRKAGKMGKGLKPALHAAPMDNLAGGSAGGTNGTPITAGGA